MKSIVLCAVLLVACQCVSAGVDSSSLRYQTGAGYSLTSVKESSTGIEGTVKIDDEFVGPYGQDVKLLNLHITYYTADIVRVKLTDAGEKRWEVPDFVSDGVKDLPKPNAQNYRVEYTKSPFGFKIVRKASNEVLFDTTQLRLVYSEYYLEIGTTMEEGANLYGLGERVDPLRLDSSGHTYTLWAKDQGTPVDKPIYASHPFYLHLRPQTGSSHGVFLLNSNGLDVVLEPGKLTYKVIGGILDFFFFMGPEPEAVIQQYQQIIGKPAIPPRWGLGFHQCRWGYNTVAETKAVADRYRAENIPLEVMWNDIDLYDQYRDFTYDPERFAPKEMKAMIDDLHTHDQKYMMIYDAGIAIPDLQEKPTKYPSYDRAVEMDIFIKRQDGKPLLGKVWPGYVHFPDFFHPNATPYWTNELIEYHHGPDGAPFDGMWLDMNEVSNFCDGECEDPRGHKATFNMRSAKDVNYSPENPPYMLAQADGNLDKKTVRMDALTGGTINYNVHNMYGFMETIASYHAMKEGLKKRPMLITRSTFPSHGRYGGHWLGDNDSNYDDMAYSIPGMLNFQMFGIPLVGADVCGFQGNTTEDLCWRWMQLGAFSPFYRNHNSIGQLSQEIYQFSDAMIASTRKTMLLRYSLHNLFYTAFYRAHTTGGTVLQPLFFLYPSDETLPKIDHQFLVAESLMVCPVLEKDAETVDAYFPADTWYDFYDGSLVGDAKSGSWQHIDAPKTKIPLFLRGGSIIPSQHPEMTIKATSGNDFSLLVALTSSGTASGHLFLDDGEGIDTVERGDYSLVEFAAKSNEQMSRLTVASTSTKYAAKNKLDSIIVYGVQRRVEKVEVCGVSADSFHYDEASHTLSISHIRRGILDSIEIDWYYSS